MKTGKEFLIVCYLEENGKKKKETENDDEFVIDFNFEYEDVMKL